ncbi:MAG: Hsp70 family protein [Mycobacteriaceae bacterium]
MNAVIGASLGASHGVHRVKLALGSTREFSKPTFSTRTFTVPDGSVQSVAKVLGDLVDSDGKLLHHSDALAIAYKDRSYAEQLQTAVQLYGIAEVRLVSETNAALEYLRSTGQVSGYSTLIFFDLGSSGVTVSAVDQVTGAVLAVERAAVTSGDNFDDILREKLSEGRGISYRTGVADQFFVEIKEALSEETEVTKEGPEGLGTVTISRDNFDLSIISSVLQAMDLVRSVIDQCGRQPDAVVPFGGGARIPLVLRALEHEIKLPVVVVADPEVVIAKGAALQNVSRVKSSYTDPWLGAPAWNIKTPEKVEVLPTSIPQVSLVGSVLSSPKARLIIAGAAVAMLGLGVIAAFSVGGGDRGGADPIDPGFSSEIASVSSSSAKPSRETSSASIPVIAPPSAKTAEAPPAAPNPGPNQGPWRPPAPPPPPEEEVLPPPNILEIPGLPPIELPPGIQLP